MEKQKFLVIGATGQVGSKITILLANRGYDVTALVRQRGATLRDPHQGTIRYVVGDLTDESSIWAAVKGMNVVISTANGVVPQRNADNAQSVNEAAIRLIAICEQAGVKRFVQSSVPVHSLQDEVPELRGKRLIEERLSKSSMQTIVVRNPAFMDVWLVSGGFQQAQDKSLHATTKRSYGLLKAFNSFVGNFVEKRGWFLAPGGPDHGSPMIATRDVAEMIVGAALYAGSENLLIESGGPQWLTWRETADIIAQKTGRRKLKIIPLPAWVAHLNQILAKPFSAQAVNTFALIRFVATYQPHWDSAETVRKLNLPRQLTVSDYLDLNYTKQR